MSTGKKFLSTEAKNIAVLICKHQQTSGKLMVSLLKQVFTDLAGKDHNPADSGLAAQAKKMLKPLMVQPGRLAQNTFDVYFVTARKCLVFGVTWQQAAEFKVEEIRSAIQRALDNTSDTPIREKINLALEEIKDQHREALKQAREEARRGPGAITLKPITSKATAKRWVSQIARSYRNFDLGKLPDDEYGRTVREFIIKCRELESRTKKPVPA